MKPVVAITIALLAGAPLTSRAQMSTRSEVPGRDGDPTDAGVRNQKATIGRSLEEFASHLDDSDPGRRLEAVRLLAVSLDPKATQYLTRAVDNPDPRVATFAVDALGKRGAKEASETLCEKLFIGGENPAFRGHVLAALGRIRDPSSARRVLAFAENEPDPELRAAAIRVIGDIGDDSVRGDVQRLGEAEKDSALKALWQESTSKLRGMPAPERGVGVDSESRSSRGEAEP